MKITQRTATLNSTQLICESRDALTRAHHTRWRRQQRTRPAASTFAHFRRRHGRRHPSTDRGRRRAHLRRRWHRQRFMLHTCSDRVSNNPLHSILLRSSRSPVSATASCLLGVAHKPTAHPAIFAPLVAWHCLEPSEWTIPVLPPWHAPSPRSSWSLLLVVFGRLGDLGGAQRPLSGVKVEMSVSEKVWKRAPA